MSEDFDPVRDGSALQNFRALIAWLGLSERQAAVELGVSQPTLQAIKNGSRVPEYEMGIRIEVMSRRWPKGLIPYSAWPKPLDMPMRKATAPAPSPLLCEHANESPRVCPCPEGCYCKSRTCKPVYAICLQEGCKARATQDSVHCPMHTKA